MAIECSAFEGCTALGCIIIPESVTTIGISAFQGCTALGKIAIPDSVMEIEKHAVLNCPSLTVLNIPRSVHRIGDGAFAECTGLTSVTEQQTKLLAEYEYVSEEITSLAEANAFSEGFRLGVELMIEVIKGNKINT